jgi:LmbE family N-acetylglucosaminyl deacetylase
MTEMKNRVRRFLRGIQRASHFPILLPHHRLEPYAIEPQGQPRRELTAEQTAALRLADGTRTLSQISREAKAPKSWLIQAHDEGLLILWRSPIPRDPPTLSANPQSIILSPHPDDAALSCGGRILSGQGTLILNAFSQTAWWRFPIADRDLPKIQACRAKEEHLVSRLTSAEIRSLDLPEALLRGHKLEEVFTAEPTETDRRVAEQLSRALTDLATRHPLAHWFIPLAIGNHIDHRLTRDAARQTLSAAVKPTHLHFYEDLPYAAKLSRGEGAGLSSQALGSALTENRLEIDDVLNWKLELLRAYWSQFTWGSLVELRQYARRAGGEIVWDSTVQPTSAASSSP